MNQHSPPTVIAVAVVLSAGRVLVGRRSGDVADAPGQDEFPGGKVEPGELIEGAAARECLEESGVLVLVGARLALVSTTSSRGPIEIHFHTARPADPHVIPAAPFAWLPIGDLVRCSFPTANASVVSILLADHSAA